MSLLTDIINNTEGLYHGNLRHYFKCLFNSRGAANPYHNIRHSLDVLIKCHDALRYYANKGQLGLLSARSLLIGGIGHDINHSGRGGNDDLNIILTLRYLDSILLEEDRILWDQIKLIVGSTEYGPKGHVFEAKSLEEQIIRDADISQACSQAWIRLVIYGLSQEMGITPEQMLRSQESFLSQIKFESEWGKETFGPAIQDKILEAKELVKILDS